MVCSLCSKVSCCIAAQCTPVSSTVVEACGDDYGFSLCSIVSISGPIFNKQDAQGASNHLCPNADKENIMAGKEMHQKDIC